MYTPPTFCPVASPESASEEEDVDLAAQPSKHGGSRNRKSYAEKLLALEAANIRAFLAEKRCYCGGRCLHKLHAKGEEGVNTVRILRAARFASKNIHCINTTQALTPDTQLSLTPG